MGISQYKSIYYIVLYKLIRMKRKQVFQLEYEYILKDFANGLKSKESFIIESKKRRLIPINLRHHWENKCYLPAKEQYSRINSSNSNKINL